MKIKFTSNFKEFEKELNNKIQRIIDSERRTIQTQNQGFLLDDESEKLLKTLLSSEKSFPQSLKEMFFKSNGEPLDYYEDEHLRAIIHELVSCGFISVKWGDGLPLFGRIEQKGRSYFEMKEKYKQMLNNGGNMQFKLLDTENENYLKKLVENPEFLINPIRFENKENNKDATILENLIKNGYLDSKGISYNIDNTGYVCVGKLTQAAKTYEEMKEKFERMNNNKTYNFGVYNDWSGSNFKDSNIMVGNTNSTQNITITNEMVDDIINTITSKIEEYGLSDKNKQELKDLVEDLKEKQVKKPNLLKRALQGIWNFAKDVGCQVLATYLSYKCGF